MSFLKELKELLDTRFDGVQEFPEAPLPSLRDGWKASMFIKDEYVGYVPTKAFPDEKGMNAFRLPTEKSRVIASGTFVEGSKQYCWIRFRGDKRLHYSWIFTRLIPSVG